mgnify:CR=1 FL=1
MGQNPPTLQLGLFHIWAHVKAVLSVGLRTSIMSQPRISSSSPNFNRKNSRFLAPVSVVSLGRIAAFSQRYHDAGPCLCLVGI